jgi:PBP1b-binding outer membrane lipoprotein LpoB
MKKVLFIALIAILLASCATQNNEFKYNRNSYDVNKHHTIKEFDKYILDKYKNTKTL